MMKNKGFTLIEVVAALVIIGLVAVPLSKSFMDSFKYQARSQVKTEANKVIEHVAEQLKRGNYFSRGSQFTNWVMESDIYGNYEESIDGLDSSVDTIELATISGMSLTSSYDVNIELLSREIRKNSLIDVPESYDATITISGEEDASVSTSSYNLNIGYNEGVLQILSVDNSGFTGDGNILIENNFSGEETVVIKVEEDLENKITAWIKGDSVVFSYIGASNVNKISLGDRDENNDKNQMIYMVKITATNKTDNTITASMESTFSMPIE